jgi:hypothetical protein
MAGKGGRRPGAGRKKGTPNRATKEIRELARQYGPDAIECLFGLMTSAKNEQTRLAAANSLLDRGFGRVSHEAATESEKTVVVEISQADAKL